MARISDIVANARATVGHIIRYITSGGAANEMPNRQYLDFSGNCTVTDDGTGIRVTVPDVPAGSVTVGNVTLTAPGSMPTIINRGTPIHALLDFTLPAGVTGPQGEPGPVGPSPTISAQETASGVAITIVQPDGETSSTVNLYNGAQGSVGPPGATGAPGADGTDGATPVLVTGTTTTGQPGTAASLSIAAQGSNTYAVNATIPRGATGDAGATGADGFSPVATVSSDATGATITITDQNGTTSAFVRNGVTQADLDGCLKVDGTNEMQAPINYATLAGNASVSVVKTAIQNAVNPPSNFFAAWVVLNSDGNNVGQLRCGKYSDGRLATELYAGASATNNLTGVRVVIEGADKKFLPSHDNALWLGGGNSRWKQIYAGSSTISTSDEREKRDIVAVPDSVLDAWASVRFHDYRWRESVATKGEKNARRHTGLVAQQVQAAFAAAGLNAAQYGLFCHDSWDAMPEEKDEKGNVTIPARPAGDRFGIRYEEALCLEAAYQRRRADRLEERLMLLESRVAALEGK